MIRIGEPAPDFEAKTSDGRTLRLSALRGKPVVLYFFPKAFTPGCSAEASLFREHYPEITACGAEVIGISTDDLATQCAFAEKTGANFPMVGDEDGKLAESFDVLWPFFRMARRVTFVIDAQGLIQGVFHNELRIQHHVQTVVQTLKRMTRAEGAHR